MFQTYIKYLIMASSLNLLLINVLNAHEMWLDPLHYKLRTYQTIYANEKVGQDFKGNTYAYLPDSYVSLDVTVNHKTTPINARIGDIPAVSVRTKEEGLTILSAETTVLSVTYETWEKFENFIKSKDLDWVLSTHKKRGLPHQDFKEAYRRYAKSLIKIGKGQGQDKALGLTLEWVVDTNPYTSRGNVIKAHVLWQGKPFANAHVSVFNWYQDDLIKTSLTTDKNGRVEIPKAKGGEFLVNAVQMIEPSAAVKAQTGAVWESLWASVTYFVDPPQ